MLFKLDLLGKSRDIKKSVSAQMCRTQTDPEQIKVFPFENRFYQIRAAARRGNHAATQSLEIPCRGTPVDLLPSRGGQARARANDAFGWGSIWFAEPLYSLIASHSQILRASSAAASSRKDQSQENANQRVRFVPTMPQGRESHRKIGHAARPPTTAMDSKGHGRRVRSRCTTSMPRRLRSRSQESPVDTKGHGCEERQNSADGLLPGTSVGVLDLLHQTAKSQS